MSYSPKLGMGIGLGIGPSSGSIGLGGGGGPYTANAVHFDGTNDWLTRGAGLTGQADAKTLTISFWFRMIGNDGIGGQLFKPSPAGALKVERSATNQIEFVVVDDTSSTAWSFTTNATFLVASGWTHFLLSIDTDGTHKLYLNDVVATFASESFPGAGTTLDQTMTDWAIAASVAGGEKHNVDMADFYYTNEAFDLTVQANRRKFIDGSGKPVDLGSDGSTPSGTAALLFMSGDTVDWHTNKGTGGGFTENGALTDAASSPSD